MQKTSLDINKVRDALKKINVNLKKPVFYKFNDIIFIGAGLKDAIYKGTEQVKNYRKYDFDGLIVYYYGYVLYKNKLYYAILHVHEMENNFFSEDIIQYLFLKNIDNYDDIKLINIDANVDWYDEFNKLYCVNIKHMNIINPINGKQLLINLFNKLYKNYKMEDTFDLFEDLIYIKRNFNINLIFNNKINVEICNGNEKAKISINKYRTKFKLFVI